MDAGSRNQQMLHTNWAELPNQAYKKSNGAPLSEESITLNYQAARAASNTPLINQLTVNGRTCGD